MSWPTANDGCQRYTRTTTGSEVSACEDTNDFDDSTGSPCLLISAEDEEICAFIIKCFHFYSEIIT